MRLVRRTTLGAVAILIAVIGLVASTTGNAQAHEYHDVDPGLIVTVTETGAVTVLNMESVEPGLTLTVTVEDDEVDIDVISKDPGVMPGTQRTRCPSVRARP